MNDQELLTQLKDAGVISEGRIYRMRLFSYQERADLRRAISDAARIQLGDEWGGWQCATGCAGMMDELQMVGWQVHGKTEVERAI